MEMSLESTIKISPEIRGALKALGRKGETYDVILRRLLDHYAKTRPLDLGEAAREIPDIEKETED